MLTAVVRAVAVRAVDSRELFVANTFGCLMVTHSVAIAIVWALYLTAVSSREARVAVTHAVVVVTEAVVAAVAGTGPVLTRTATVVGMAVACAIQARASAIAIFRAAGA